MLETIWIWSVDARSSLQSLQGNESVTALALDGRDSVLASAGYDGTIMIWDRKDLDGKPGFEFRTFLFDPKAMDKSKKAASFNVVEAHTGQTISYTLPCGSPIPAGAVCTCNCVPGAYTSPVRHRGTGYTYCSCNKVCTCVPICQAHRLLHDDPNIRLMAEQLLLAMGVGELDYMRWAATQSDQRLRRRIGEVMETIVGGAKARISRWPSTHLLTRYLNHPDEVTRIMAAQMVSLGRRARSDILPPHTRRQIVSLLKRSRALHWKNR